MRAFKEDDLSFDNRLAAKRARPIEIEESLDKLGWVLDDLIRIPGLNWRIGLDALVGLIPGVGDTATTVASLYVLGSAVRYRVPKITLLRMGLNLGIDYALGSLPLIGDVFDAWFKSNQKNIALLRQRATVSASEAREGRVSDYGAARLARNWCRRCQHLSTRHVAQQPFVGARLDPLGSGNCFSCDWR
jgi:hypothetical protein